MHIELGAQHFDAREQLREVVGFRPGERLADDRVVAQRFRSALEGFVERLRGVQAANFGRLFGILFRSRLGGERGAVFGQEGLQVGARVGVERIEHLVELDGVGGLRDRDRGARGERPRGGAAGLQFDEELPSRKIRGRILSVASSWIGRPLPSISMLTSAACPHAGWR